MEKKRVVSLLPSATEIVYALGAADQLVGRSHECDYTSDVRALPACTSANMDSTAPSGAIDREVKELSAKTSSLYELDGEKVKQLRPDLIITQAQCDVCAINLDEVERVVGQWPGKVPQIVSLAPNRLADIWDDIRKVADALDLTEHGREVLRALKKRVVNIIEKTCMMQTRPNVLCIEWIEPLMAAGNWVPELVELAGGKNVLGESGKHSTWTNWETIQKLDPEIIVAMPCGFDLARTRKEMATLTDLPGWSNLRAVKKRRVYNTDGNAYFNRPGPRIVESLEILAEIFYPDRFNFGHKGKHWE